ncbi:MAG: hypothetical protein WBV94_06185 [Blastocatellia bacterium]
MNLIARTLVVFVFGLSFINSINPALAFDDKSKADNSALFERVGARERIYNISFDEMLNLCNKAAFRTFENVHTDRDKGVLEMDSGISLSRNAFHIVVNLEKVDAGRTRIKISTQKKRFLSWGSGDRLANDFFKAIDEQLKPDMAPKIKM